MGDDDAPVGDLWRDLGQHARDILVGQAVKTIAADARVMETAGQGEPVGEIRAAAVEGGIEAGHLRQVRLHRGNGADAGEIVRLVQGCERTERLELGEHSRIDPDRRGVVDPAMHHPVTHAEQ